MLEIKRKVYKVSIDEKIYDLREPSIMELQALSKAREEESIKEVINLIDSLGIPSDVVNTLSLEAVESILNLIIPKKKN